MVTFGNIAGYIFDLDGTLLDTEPLYTQAGQAVIAPFGKTFDPELKKRTMGGDSRTSAAIIIEHYGLPLSVEEFLSQRQEILLKLFPGAPEIVGAAQRLDQGRLGLGQPVREFSAHRHSSDAQRLSAIGRPAARRPAAA